MNKDKPDFVERYKYSGDYDRDKKMLERWSLIMKDISIQKTGYYKPPLNKNGCIEHKVLRDENFKYKPNPDYIQIRYTPYKIWSKKDSEVYI